MILVVNGCRDRSLEVCQALSKQYSPVRVVQSEKGGWGLAVKLGLKEAQGDLLCYTNSARTSPEDLALLLLYAVVYPQAVIKANRKNPGELAQATRFPAIQPGMSLSF